MTQLPIAKSTKRMRIISSDDNWLEGDAIQQLEKTLELPGMVFAVGMPDLHPGKGGPVGAVFATQGHIYPHLVGNDIGCGMSFWRTDLKSRKLKLDKWERKLSDLEKPGDGLAAEWLNDRDIEPTEFDSSLGTVGGGNHFAELQVMEHDYTHGRVDENLDKEHLYLLMHSGSRGLGESILRRHVDKFKGAGIEESSEDFTSYLTAHDHAVRWARANRELIAHNFVTAIGSTKELILDACHNSVTSGTISDASVWLHRKGAAPSDQGLIVIPGSRGALSYLVKPVGDHEINLSTLAHGAGRKWRRTECKGRLERRYIPDSLRRTELGSRVICEEKRLLYEEAPQAYKNVDVVVGDLVRAGCIEILATFRPVLTYKVGSSRERGEE